MSSAAISLRERDAWICAVIGDANLSHGTVRVAVRIAMHLNLKSGRCDPSHARVAAGTGLSRRMVMIAVASLEAAGWLRRDGRRGGATNAYAINCERALEALKSTSEDANGDLSMVNEDSPSGLGGGEPGFAIASEDGEPGFAKIVNHRAPDGEPGFTQTSKNIQQNSEDSISRRGTSPGRHLRPVKVSDDLEAAFEGWWSQYPKKVDKAEARKLYIGIVEKKGATVGELQAGVERYARQRDGHDPKYTRSPARWLRNENWADAEEQPSASSSRHPGLNFNAQQSTYERLRHFDFGDFDD